MGDGVNLNAAFTYNIAANSEQKAPSRRIPPVFFFFFAFHISSHKNTRRSHAACSPTSIILPICFFCRSHIWLCELESILQSVSVFSLRLLRAILKELDCQRRLFSKPGSDSTAGSKKKTRKPVSCRRPDGVSPTFSSPSSFRLMTSRSKSVLSPLLLLNRTRPVSPSQWACKGGSQSSVKRRPRQPDQPDQWKPQIFCYIVIRISCRPSPDNIMRDNGRPWE